MAIFHLAIDFLRRLARERRGNVVIIAAIAAPVLLGALGLGFEVAGWYQGQRSMQNAADSAAIAAASNATASYATEAAAVAAQYGYQNGVNNVTVTASNTAACPSGGNTCYSVAISGPTPLVLSSLLGYQGDTTIGSPGAPAKLLAANAVALPIVGPRNYCLLTLATGNSGIRANGAPNANLNGCDTMSNGDSTCNGGNLSVSHADAHGTSSGCGAVQDSNMPLMADPYSGLAAHIPANTCSSYPQEPSKKTDPALPVSNQLSGSVSWSGTVEYCGDVQLTGNLNITTSSPGAVLVIENGQLDTNGFTMKTLANAGVTVIFSGTAGNYTHGPTGGGTLDLAAPTSGTWSGTVLYQDPNLTSGVDISAAGNSPAWDLTGLVYLPHSNVLMSGAVNKSSNGYSCFALVSNTFQINGTGNILDEGQCTQAGLVQPTAQVPTRGGLVA